MARNNDTGAWGEALAAAHLKRHGFRIVKRNYRGRFGEIDIIAENREYIVFAEVKLRKNDGYGTAREFVGAEKQRRIILTAMAYLEAYPTRLQPRFDVVEIYASDGTKTKHPTIIYLEDAFA